MDANYIQNVLLRENLLGNYCLHRFTPPNWFECDVLKVSKNGYTTEFEIKCSRADFRADRFKRIRHRFYDYDNPPPLNPTKYERLQAGDPAGPNYFYYVTPKGLIEPSELPPFVGLLVVETKWSECVVQAPKLHRSKCEEAVLNKIFKACYYRFHDLRRQVERNTPEATTPVKQVA